MNSKAEIEERLIRAFKELVIEEPVEKITVRQITDRAGVIRTTFYHHFQDKYELMERIVHKQIIQPIEPLVENDMIDEAVILIFSNFVREKELYRKMAKTSGQNSFEQIVQKCVKDIFFQVIGQKIQARIDAQTMKRPWLSPEMVAIYYAQTMTFIVMYWIERGMPYTPREIAEIYEYILTHSLQDVVDELAEDAEEGRRAEHEEGAYPPW